MRRTHVFESDVDIRLPVSGDIWNSPRPYSFVRSLVWHLMRTSKAASGSVVQQSKARWNVTLHAPVAAADALPASTSAAAAATAACTSRSVVSWSTLPSSSKAFRRVSPNKTRQNARRPQRLWISYFFMCAQGPLAKQVAKMYP